MCGPVARYRVCGISGGSDSVRSAGIERKANESNKHKISMRIGVHHPNMILGILGAKANNNGMLPLSASTCPRMLGCVCRPMQWICLASKTSADDHVLCPTCWARRRCTWGEVRCVTEPDDDDGDESRSVAACVGVSPNETG